MNLEALLKYPLIFLTAFAVTYALVPLVRMTAIRLDVVDRPGERRLNGRVVPRAGGIAVFCGFHAACAVLYLLPWSPISGTLDGSWWAAFFSASFLILMVGLIDDVQGLRPSIKLFSQCVAATLLYLAGANFGGMLGVELSPLIDFAFTLFWIVAITNAFNLIDGLDGLAAGLASIGALGLAVALFFRMQSGDALVLIGLIGACLAFLRYNFYPASIFLGDSGSLFLGLSLATISLSTGLKGTAMASIGVPLLAVGVPIFDTMLAVWRRSLRSVLADDETTKGKRGLMAADMDHLHHRLVRLGLTQRRAALWLYLLNFCLVSVGLLSFMYRSHSIGIFLAAFVVGSYVVVRHLARVELWDSGRLILAGMRQPREGVLTAVLYPIFDILILAAGFYAAVYFSLSESSLTESKIIWRDEFPVWGGMGFLGLVAARSYSRVWSRARISDFAFLAMALLGAVLLAASWSIMGFESFMREIQLRAILYFSFSVGGILGVRAFPRVVEDSMSLLASRSQERNRPSKRLLVVGAKDRCLLFLRSVAHTSTGDCVVGLMADEPNLRKRWVHGYCVLGSVAEIPQKVKELSIDEIVIAENLSARSNDFIARFAVRSDIKVREWRFELLEWSFPSPEDTSDRMSDGSPRVAQSERHLG